MPIIYKYTKENLKVTSEAGGALQDEQDRRRLTQLVYQLYLMGSWSSLFSLLWIIFIPFFLARGHPERL